MPLIFLHIPKTAGLSLRDILLKHIPGPSFRIIHPIDDTARLAALPEPERAALELVEGHLYYGVHELLPSPSRYLTMLRDPVERVLSYYSFVREFKDHHLNAAVNRPGFTLADCFRSRLTIELDNFMVRCLAGSRHIHVPFGGVTSAMLDEAAANLDRIDLLGLTEHFDKSLARFCAALNWPTPPAPRLNTTSARLRRVDLYDEESALIAEHNRFDAALYRRARELFDAKK
jgi:hypothetical protein